MSAVSRAAHALAVGGLRGCLQFFGGATAFSGRFTTRSATHFGPVREDPKQTTSEVRGRPLAKMHSLSRTYSRK